MIFCWNFSISERPPPQHNTTHRMKYEISTYATVSKDDNSFLLLHVQKWSVHNILTVLNKSILKTLQIGKWELISMYVLSFHNHCVCLYTKAIHMIIRIQYISWVHVYTIIVYSNLHIHSWFWSCRYRDWQGIYSGTYIHTSLIYIYVYIVPRVKQKGLMTKQYLYLSS